MKERVRERQTERDRDKARDRDTEREREISKRKLPFSKIIGFLLKWGKS